MENLIALMAKPFEYGAQLLNGITIPFLNVSAMNFMLAGAAAGFAISVFRWLLGLQNNPDGDGLKNKRISSARRGDTK